MVRLSTKNSKRYGLYNWRIRRGNGVYNWRIQIAKGAGSNGTGLNGEDEIMGALNAITKKGKIER